MTKCHATDLAYDFIQYIETLFLNDPEGIKPDRLRGYGALPKYLQVFSVNAFGFRLSIQ